MYLCYRRLPFVLSRRKFHVMTECSWPEHLREEDCSPFYDSALYFPGHVGQKINRFDIVSKLGWGTHSTVWLAKEAKKWPWQSDQFVTLKITNASPDDSKVALEEIEISRRIKKMTPEPDLHTCVRLVDEHFNIDGPHGKHLVLVFEPLREPLWMLGRRLGQRGLPLLVLKAFLKIIPMSLKYIHSCGVVHTDLKADNILLGFENESVILDYVKQQLSQPCCTKDVGGHIIYESRSDFGPLRKAVGRIKLSDFGSAVVVEPPELRYHEIQPQGLEAPEVLFRAGWNQSADIWNLGVMLWELLQDHPLALGHDPSTGKYDRKTHFAQLHKLLGPPPQTFLHRADKVILDGIYTREGQFILRDLIPSDPFDLSSFTHSLTGPEKVTFIRFASKMLKWLPEERASAQELYEDSYLSL